jgi:hypothetical protein
LQNPFSAANEARARKFVEGGGVRSKSSRRIIRLRLKAIDLRMLSEAEREVESEVCSAKRRAALRFNKRTLLRIRLLASASRMSMFLFLAVHPSSRRWSWAFLLHELWSLYQGLSTGKTPSLPKLLVRYRDYAPGSAHSFTRGHGNGLLFGETIGRGAAPRAIDRSSAPAAQSFSRRAQENQLDESVTATLNQLSQREGVTLFMTLLAAFQVLLYRYSGQEDIMSVRRWPIATKVGSRGHRLSRQHARLARGSFRSTKL